MQNSISNDANSPFHAGERAVQERLGVREKIEPFAQRVIRPYLPQQHRDFYEQLPFIVAAARDPEDRPWVTLLGGYSGFISSPSESQMQLNVAPFPGEPLQSGLVAGADIGLLGIEFSSRRRNRVNGRIGANAAPNAQQGSTPKLDITVDQSFGNCPQYIQPRRWEAVVPDSSPTITTRSKLTESQQQWIAHADTFFIGTGHRGTGEAAHFGMDASHRGGEPGFVQVADTQTLVWPDYSGNNHYNTVGNLTLDPRVGMLFIDFENGHLLQLTGRATIDWDSPKLSEFPGAKRLVNVIIEQVIERTAILPMRWATDDQQSRELRVAQRRQESNDVVSFTLVDPQGQPLPEFKAGQHLPIELTSASADTKISRTYSLSSGPADPYYRISVKREPMGEASQLLHDQLREGALLTAGNPAGDFHWVPTPRPTVLLSAGVGITPMVSMLRTLAQQPVTFMHGAQDSEHHPLKHEIEQLILANANFSAYTCYSQPLATDRVGQDYDQRGRLTIATLESVLTEWAADYYLCGPSAFMGHLHQELRQRGVPDAQIHSESFGPQSG